MTELCSAVDSGQGEVLSTTCLRSVFLLRHSAAFGRTRMGARVLSRSVIRAKGTLLRYDGNIQSSLPTFRHDAGRLVRCCVLERPRCMAEGYPLRNGISRIEEIN
jgi:hypothetical protein